MFGLLLRFPLGVFPLPVLVLKERLYLQEQDAGKGLYEQKAESILLTLLYKVNALHTLARNLMQLIAPGAPETGAGAAQTAAPAQTGGAPNAVEELKQYKSLLDAGVITEEEFAAKKRQLLGI
ncbi:SHOCT domain-containing protein [Oscillibacter sp. MSJ-31]|uniref:SHOCT domain-containing protein n=1 Tax=Oscillibacter sp. MSJ-31 TaxID=2841526 RepID=UPI0020A06BE8|nr:SHOCT domain-containing protein [Oscillibacter sp. MSJ-31]